MPTACPTSSTTAPSCSTGLTPTATPASRRAVRRLSGPAPPTNTAGLITVTPDQQAAAQAAFPLVASLRRWVAPFTGTIDITGQIFLTQTGDAAADGVRAAIQLENNEIFSLTIADPTDLTPKPITALTGIAVTAGQRLYFRVNSRNDGAFDTVSFDPTITYRTVNGVAVAPTTLDENGLPLFATTASADYAYGGLSFAFFAPAGGTVNDLRTNPKPDVNTNNVGFSLTLKSTAVARFPTSVGRVKTASI